MIYKLEKPNLSKINRDKAIKLFLNREDQSISNLFNQSFSPIYLYWDRIKYKTLPKNISNEEFWYAIKFIRHAQFIKTVIKNENEDYFKWLKLPDLEQFLHEADLDTGGSLFGFTKSIDEKTKYKFISRGIIEEAIASSQLEGANTTRRIAKQMLREKRKPTTSDEQMIFNNYMAMQAIEEEYKDQELNLDLLFELHRLIAKDTIQEDEVGRFRKDSEKIIVGERDKSGKIYHIPPKAAFIKKEIKNFIKFANDELETPFIHPIIKAIMIHFWIGYLHPFTDGNGRLARLLFYWYLLKNNYWAFAYLPISKIIKKSPIQYGNAYLYSEQDDLDLTYFIDYNIRKIKIAIENFREYFESKSKKNLKMNKLSKMKYNLNDRQIQLLQYYYEDKDARTSTPTHMNINRISRKTAINDLKELEKLGFLISERSGKRVYYYTTDKVRGLF